MVDNREVHQGDPQVRAARHLVDVWSASLPAPDEDGYCTLQCDEADALAGLFEAFGQPRMAEEVIYRHSLSDEPGDAHYKEDGK